MRGNQIRFSIFKECALLGQAAPDELSVLAGLPPGPEEARLSSLDLGAANLGTVGRSCPSTES
jgi:hypothetical protein